MSDHPFEFDILGQKIVIKNAEEAALAAVAVKVVDEKIKNIMTEKPHLGPQQIAILALLELAGDLVKDRSMIDQYREELDRKCSALLLDLKRTATA